MPRKIFIVSAGRLFDTRIDESKKAFSNLLVQSHPVNKFIAGLYTSAFLIYQDFISNSPLKLFKLGQLTSIQFFRILSRYLFLTDECIPQIKSAWVAMSSISEKRASEISDLFQMDGDFGFLVVSNSNDAQMQHILEELQRIFSENCKDIDDGDNIISVKIFGKPLYIVPSCKVGSFDINTQLDKGIPYAAKDASDMKLIPLDTRLTKEELRKRVPAKIEVPQDFRDFPGFNQPQIRSWFQWSLGIFGYKNLSDSRPMLTQAVEHFLSNGKRVQM